MASSKDKRTLVSLLYAKGHSSSNGPERGSHRRDPTLFAFYGAPTDSASTALHIVNLYRTSIRSVFAELSKLSRSADEILSGDPMRQGAGRIWAGDPVAGMEQCVTGLRTNEIAQGVLKIL